MTGAQKGILAALVAALVVGIVCGIYGFELGRMKARPSEPTIIERIDTVTITEIRIDTVERVRTVTAYLPIVEDEAEPMDTIDYPYTPDSVAVQIPISRYVAEQDSLYRVVAEGYAVDFKEITVYPKTVTITTTVETRKPTHWGIGIQAGYGATLQDRTVRLSPYVGVGISYNILTW